MLAIDVWHDSLTINHAQYLQEWQILDNTEKTQAERFKNPQLQQRYVAAHGRLRHILAHYLNVSPASIRIEKTVQGKPYLVDYSELAFNLSHTGNHLLVAVAENCQLGVDIEQCKHRAGLSSLVHKCFSTEEALYWQRLPEAEQLSEFYQFWTRKEAFVKATGFGIALGLRECVLNPEYPSVFLAVPTVCGTACTWQCRDLAVGEKMCAALVTDKAIASVTLKSSV